MRTLISGAVVACLFVCLAPSAFADPILTNGSLTGSVANGGVPTGWTIVTGSPDTNDITHNVGGATPWGVTPSGASPDGGTWVGMGASGSFNEIFKQTVSGFVVGVTYNLDWYAGNFGAKTGSPFYLGDNAIAALIDGTVEGTGATISLGANWHAQGISFTATSTTHTISFGLATGTRSYLSIDGISLSAVPEPGTLALLGLGLFGVALHRTRRRARA